MGSIEDIDIAHSWVLRLPLVLHIEASHVFIEVAVIPGLVVRDGDVWTPFGLSIFHDAGELGVDGLKLFGEAGRSESGNTLSLWVFDGRLSSLDGLGG
jgi:hypothetical protein